MPKEILYAEDETIARIFLNKFISKCGEVTLAQDGQEAYELYKQKEFDLIITDLCMPRMDGAKFIDLVRRDNKDIPIIVTTAYRDEYKELEKSAIIVEKPINTANILKVISSVLSEK